MVVVGAADNGNLETGGVDEEVTSLECQFIIVVIQLEPAITYQGIAVG